MRQKNTENKNTNINADEGPLGNHPRNFLDELESQHYSQGRIAEYKRCINLLGQFVKDFKIDIKQLNAESVAKHIKKLFQPPSRKIQVPFIIKRFIEYLTEVGVVDPSAQSVSDGSAHSCLKLEYEGHLRHQRGLSESTIYHCWYVANRFLKFRFKDRNYTLSAITQNDIIKFIQQQAAKRKQFRNRNLSTHLRNFFLFLFRNSKIKVNLAAGIPSIRFNYATSLPRYLPPEQVETLIASVKADTPLGRRNYAMLILMARLGLRATEVIAIQLDDIDWRASELIIRGKGKIHDRLPIPDDVGKALVDYIQNDRKRTSRRLFITERSPRKPFIDAQIVNEILKQAFARTNLKTPVKYAGSHVLRHSLATKMLRQGASLEEIGDVLRHRTRSSTMIYAKLDIDGMRSIARPWPVAGGAK